MSTLCRFITAKSNHLGGEGGWNLQWSCLERYSHWQANRAWVVMDSAASLAMQRICCTQPCQRKHSCFAKKVTRSLLALKLRLLNRNNTLHHVQGLQS